MTENLGRSSIITEPLRAGNPPTEENKVVISFLGDEALAGSVIELGFDLLDRSKIDNRNVDCENYEDINKYNFNEKGFQTLIFDDEILHKIRPLYDISHELLPNEVNSRLGEDPEIQRYIDYLQEWIKQKYTDLTGEDDIIAVCSRNVVMRIAGCDKICQIPGNPLFHLDYISFEATYERQCQDQEKYKFPAVCPPFEQMIDVVNIWFPTTEVQDWPLGFLDIDSVEIRDYVPIQLVFGSQASSLRYKEDLKVYYKDKMRPPEVYFFRSATKDSSKKGVIHGSFRITDIPFQRRSVEVRCCIFKNVKPGKGGNKTKKAKKYIKRRTKKRR
jgi:hypothetical protein